jgi:hypothetical protein
MLDEPQAPTAVRKQSLQLALAHLQGLPSKILAVDLQEIEQKHVLIVR